VTANGCCGQSWWNPEEENTMTVKGYQYLSYYVHDSLMIPAAPLLSPTMLYITKSFNACSNCSMCWIVGVQHISWWAGVGWTEVDGVCNGFATGSHVATLLWLTQRLLSMSLCGGFKAHSRPHFGNKWKKWTNAPFYYTVKQKRVKTKKGSRSKEK